MSLSGCGRQLSLRADSVGDPRNKRLGEEMSAFLFTSESVSEGHPDKVADQISDAVLDAILEQDATGRVAAETLVSTGLVVMTGEITTRANVDYGRVARETIRAIGYNDPALRFDADGCSVMVCYGRQSPNIAQGVDHASDDFLNQGAGDQGLMFGYACDETPSLMPFPIYYAHRLVQRQSEVRRDGRLPFLRPDAKSQVTVRYVDGKPHSVDTVVLSTQHDPSMNDSQGKLAEAVIEEIIKPVFPPAMLNGAGIVPRSPALVGCWRVAAIDPSPPPCDGGGSIYPMQLVSGLAART